MFTYLLATKGTGLKRGLNPFMNLAHAVPSFVAFDKLDVNESRKRKNKKKTDAGEKVKTLSSKSRRIETVRYGSKKLPQICIPPSGF